MKVKKYLNIKINNKDYWEMSDEDLVWLAYKNGLLDINQYMFPYRKDDGKVGVIFSYL